MAEKLIPISKKQFDSINNLRAAIKANEAELRTGVNWILQGNPDDLGTVNVGDAVCRDGVYSLIVETADIAPPITRAAATEAATA